MKAYIKAISYYLPEQKLTNEDLQKEFPEWSADKITSKLGIQKRHIAGEETVVDMAEKASIKLFEESQFPKEQIDFILLCTQSPDYFLPTSACIVQSKLGLPKHCGALDFNLGCSGYVYGLSLAKGLISSGSAKNILLITSETYSKHIHPQDKSNKSIFGDAATATIVSAEDGFCEIQSFTFGTDGRGAENLMVKSGGLKYPEKLNEVDIDENEKEKYSDHLYMNGSQIFTFTLTAVPKLIKQVLSVNDILQEDINLFIFHQANKYMLNFLRKKVKIEEDDFYYFIEEVGNTVSSTIPIAIYNAMKENRINKEDNVLLAGFGVGYSWSGTVLKY